MYVLVGAVYSQVKTMFCLPFLCRNGKYVALKILVSDASGQTSEVQILHTVSDCAPSEGQRYITQPLGEFEHSRPNGRHKCLVFEPLGPSINSMVEELPQLKPRKRHMKVRYPPDMAKSILKQSLQALAFLHGNGIAHGDFQPGDMLFTVPYIDSIPEEELRQEENVESGSISPPDERKDGKEDLLAPRYLCIAQPLAPFTHYAKGFKIKLSDMGGDPPQKPVTPVGLRAPEMIFKGEVNKSLDVWSFGCLVFELIAGQQLFCIPGSDDEDDEHLLTLTERLGPPPDRLFDQWKTFSLYFTPDRTLFNVALGGVADGEEPLMLEQESMEDAFDKAVPEIDEEESRKVKTLIRWILQYEPSRRPSPAEILRDPWFTGIEVDETTVEESPA
ncbi:serine protein kinase [Pochonia chlamydosporia 170]|uniref:Serine protein kinase n=1 Tax=Pochonia chlamydosporia 170 TaxID=1380566 RepID=A0A179F2E0_METCM|nr:serine protein kinase [Pochonia chlamydosporia 170]OAQ59551.1 serine protein kinase [Pochonia chlamydosporia 170]